MTGTTQQQRSDSIDIRLSLIEQVVIKLDKGINGNGKPGLLDRTQCLENQMDEHLKDYRTMVETKKQADKERSEFWGKVVLLVIGMIVSNVGVIIFAVFR